jgi:hypothetical protein
MTAKDEDLLPIEKLGARWMRWCQANVGKHYRFIPDPDFLVVEAVEDVLDITPLTLSLPPPAVSGSEGLDAGAVARLREAYERHALADAEMHAAREEFMNEVEWLIESVRHGEDRKPSARVREGAAS